MNTTTSIRNFTQRLADSIARQNSLLCVGLDPVWDKLPTRYKSEDVARGIFDYAN
jgi:hypothetical protein